MVSATNANPDLFMAILPGYDSSGHQVNVAVQILNVQTDNSVSPPIVSGALAVTTIGYGIVVIRDNATGTPARVNSDESLQTMPSGAHSFHIAAGVTTDTVVKSSLGIYYGVFAITAASGASLIYDNASAGSGTAVGVIPVAIGYSFVPPVGIQCVNGITVKGNAANPEMIVLFF